MAANAQDVQLSDDQLREALRRALENNEKEVATKIGNIIIDRERQANTPKVGDIAVETSPVPVPPDRTITTGAPLGAFRPGASLGQATPQATITQQGATPQERDMAARGVDVREELRDNDLRSNLGFAPNEAFKASFLAEKIAEKTGLPKEQVVQFDRTGALLFFNPDTRRYTPIDSNSFTTSDLRDMYGPGGSIAGTITGAVLGGFAGGPAGAIAGGSTATFFAETARLFHGRTIGVHDLSDNDIYIEALKAAGIDAAGGVAGHGLAKLKALFRQMKRPEGMSQNEAQAILDGLGKNIDDIEEVNRLLRISGSKNRLKIDPVAQAEDSFGLEVRSTASKATEQSRALRASELKANENALDDLARFLNFIDEPRPGVVTNQGASTAARPVQSELRRQADAIQSIADNNLHEAEVAARAVLDDFGLLNRTEAGQQVGKLVAAHANGLDGAKNDAWESYQRAIGQAVKGDEGYDASLRFVSNHKVPITPDVRKADRVLAAARKQSLLANKAKGSKPIKAKSPTTTTVTESPIIRPDGTPARTTSITKKNTIDLAVLDDDIKEVRALLRSGDQGFSKTRLREARDVLVKLRNDYLAEHDPAALRLLEQAERKTAVYSDFVNDSVFSSILKVTPEGVFVPDNINAFKHVFTADSADSMRALVTVARGQPGGLEALQKIGLQIYKANVIPVGGTVPDLKLHNQFVAQHKEVMAELYGDPGFYRFGELADNIARKSARADRVKSVLAKSPLAKFSRVSPEEMGNTVFMKGVSEKDIANTIIHLNRADPLMLKSFRESVGRSVYKQITTNGVLQPTKLGTLLETKAGKLEAVFGAGYVHDLRVLQRAINLNRIDVIGPKLEKQTVFGLIMRTMISPPLTKRGRAQTLVEQLRFEALNDALNRAVRDPEVLRQIVKNGNRDIRDKRVLNLFGQIGALSAIGLDEDEAQEQ